DTDTDTDTDTAVDPQSGVLTVLCYNVAGLPQGISGSNPEVNTPLISPLLNGYDLVLVQEDFYYHEELIAEALHPYQSERSGDGVNDLGDGLNRFSQSAFGPHKRITWEACYGQLSNGSDCLAKKGFSVAEHELAPGVLVDVYNLHMDAGRDPEDVTARAEQAEQLAATIADRSAGKALIVAGDTNMKEEDEVYLQGLIDTAGLTDSCRALNCGEELRIDRVLYRSSATLGIDATAWALDPVFVDTEGADLSDHKAVAVTLQWTSPPI
ncbi:MAG TPA: endonuclease, partial [Nannocystis exedens]|nr:endonuclease [Nannocystis exedens]